MSVIPSGYGLEQKTQENYDQLVPNSQKKAIQLAKGYFEPRLLKRGFSGNYPYYHRIGENCVECIEVYVSVRTGVRIELGALPLRPKLEARTAKQDCLKFMGSPLPDGVLRHHFLHFLPIRTTTDLSSLPKRLPGLWRKLLSESGSFWGAYPEAVERRS